MIKQIKKKKGITLIEETVVLGLISIFSLIGVKAYCVYKNIIYDIEINQFLYDIEDTLSYGKEYCYNNGKVGDYIVEKNNGNLRVIFKCENEIRRETELQGKVIIVKENWISEISSKSLTISNKGYIQSDTINFKDEKGRKYKITIRPGGNIITVKEEN